MARKNKIERAKGNWRPGQVVKVGSLTLIVDKLIETKAGEPNAFGLDSFDRTRHYQFQAFRGLRRVA